MIIQENSSKVSDTAYDEMERLRSKSLPSQPLSVIHTTDHDKYLSILYFNIANLQEKHLHIHCDEDFKLSDVISINETWLDTGDDILPKMLGLSENYKIFR